MANNSSSKIICLKKIKKKKENNRLYMLVEQGVCVCLCVRLCVCVCAWVWGVQCLCALWTMTSVCYYEVLLIIIIVVSNVFMEKKIAPLPHIISNYVHHYLYKGFPKWHRCCSFHRKMPVVDISESAKRLTSMFNLLSILSEYNVF